MRVKLTLDLTFYTWTFLFTSWVNIPKQMCLCFDRLLFGWKHLLLFVFSFCKHLKLFQYWLKPHTLKCMRALFQEKRWLQALWCFYYHFTLYLPHTFIGGYRHVTFYLKDPKSFRAVWFWCWICTLTFLVPKTWHPVPGIFGYWYLCFFNVTHVHIHLFASKLMPLSTSCFQAAEAWEGDGSGRPGRWRGEWQTPVVFTQHSLWQCSVGFSGLGGLCWKGVDICSLGVKRKKPQQQAFPSPSFTKSH